MDIQIQVDGQIIRSMSGLVIFAPNSKQFVRFVFDLSDDWLPLMSFAQFTQSSNSYNAYLDNDNCAYLPSEIKTGNFSMMLYGSSNGVVATTHKLDFQMKSNDFISDGNSTDISESLYEQLVDKFDSMMGLDEDQIKETVMETTAEILDEYLADNGLADVIIKDGSITKQKLGKDVTSILDLAESAIQQSDLDETVNNIVQLLNAYESSNDQAVNDLKDKVSELADNINTACADVLEQAKAYTDQVISDYKPYKIVFVDELPESGEEFTYYLVSNKAGNGYDKYWWVTDNDGNSKWDVFGGSSTLVVTELPEIGDPEIDYILNSSAGCLYYKWIDDEWRLVAGTLSYIGEELPDASDANDLTDYYIPGDHGIYLHYRFINGEFCLIGGDSYSKEEIDAMLRDMHEKYEQADTELSIRISDTEGELAELQTEMAKYSNAVADVTKSDDGITVSYVDGSTKDITINTGTIIDSWYQDDEGYLHLYDTEGNDIVDPVYISGGGGSTTMGSALITRITEASTQCIFGDDCNIEYNFTAVDSSGETVGSGVGTWSVGGVVKATVTVNQGDNSFNIGQYLASGTNSVKLSVSVDTGGESMTVVTKTWTVNAVNLYFTWTYDDAQINTSSITDRWTPYGDISKTTYTYVDGDLIDTNVTTRTGVAQSVTIPMQEHGSHMVERYMTATVNGIEIRTESQYHDMIFVAAGDTTPIISCSYNGGTLTQYNTVQIPIVVYDPANLTSDVELAVNGEQVATWTGIDRTIHYWNYTPSEAGEMTLTITSGSASKTITVNVEAVDIDVEEVSGYAFKFKASDFATNEALRQWESNGVSMSFSSNFDWTNGGLQSEYDEDNNLRQFFCVKAGTTATVNYKLFEDDAKRYGKAFKFIYKAVNCRDYDAGVLSCYDGSVGVQVFAQNAFLSTEQNTLETITCKDDYTEFEFNIHPDSEYRYLQFWMDGSPDSLSIYAQNDNLTQSSAQTITIGSSDCDVYVYMVKAYDSYLTNENVCDNFISDAPNASEMVARYNRNDILNDKGEVSYEKLYEKNPECRVILIDTPRMTNGKSDTVTGCSVRHIYQNGGNAHCWNAANVEMKGQGTTSDNYGDSARNLDLNFTSGFDLDTGSHVDTYSMTDHSIGINYMNVKLNVASSENCNNAKIADWYNTYQPYLSANKEINSDARDTMEFHPCAIYIADQSGELFGDTEYHFYGIGDIGNSKKNTQVFHDETNPQECCVEILNNTNDLCLMHSADFSNEAYDGDGSFEFRYPSNPTEEMKEAWERFVTFMYEHDPNQATGNKLDEAKTYGSYTFKGIGKGEDVLAGTTISDFAGTYEYDTYEYRIADLLEHCEEYMIMDSVVYHYVFIESLGMVDSVAKNTFWTSSDLVHWDMTKDYDNDTALGNDNEGGMTISYGTETDDPKGDGYAFNAHDAVWIEFVENLYDARARMYINRESAGCWDAEAFLSKLQEYQETRPERLWAADTQRKYLRPYESSGTESYIPMLHGKKTHQRRQFKFYNEYYYASCYVAALSTSQLVTVRCYTPSDWSGVKPENSVELTMYANCYITIRSASTTKRIRATREQPYTLTFDEVGTLNDTETYFYTAPMIEKIGSIAHLYIGYCNFSYATLLQEISVGSDADGYVNNNLTNISFGNNTMLEYLQIQNCPNVTSSLDLTGCQSLKTLLLEGSGFTGISIATRGLLETAHLPSPASLTLRELYYLTDFTMESYDNLSTLRLEDCPTLDSQEIATASVNLTRIRITNVSWTLPDTSLLSRLVLLAGLDENDYNTETSVLTGYGHVPSISQHTLDTFNEAWPNFTIEYDEMTAQYLVTFQDYDGTVLYTEYVDRGDTATDPVEAGLIPTPVRESDAQYDYEYIGWSDSLAVVLSDLLLTAVYATTVRIYTVRWYLYSGSLLATQQVEYGSEAVYNGEMPTRTEGEFAYTYRLFTGWDKATGCVRGDVDVYAEWDTALWPPEEGTTISDMSVTELYAMTKINNNAFAGDSIVGEYAELKDRVNVDVGHDLEFSNVTSHTLVEAGEDLVLDGTSAGIKEFDYHLFADDAPSFTLAIDFEYTGDTASATDATMISCFEYNGSEGFRLRCSGGNPSLQWGNADQTTVGYNTYRNVLVLRHESGSNDITYYIFNSENTVFSDSVDTGIATRNNSTHTDAPLVIGGIKYPSDNGSWEDGVYNYFANGVIHYCKLWLDDLGDHNARELAAWYHETWAMEYTGTARYVLATGNGSRFSNASFMCSHALSLSHSMNKTNTSAGGWDESEMRKFMNPTYNLCSENHETDYEGYGRTFAALPYEWQSIICQVRVAANGGANDTTVNESYDYMHLASLVEITGDSSSVYSNEGTQIGYLSSSRYRSRFSGIATSETAQYFTTSSEPTSLGNTCSSGDVWQLNGGYCYVFVSDEYIQKYNITTSSVPISLAYTADGGGWVLASTYSLRSPDYTSTTYFYGISAQGVNSRYSANTTRAIVPCFSI